jgi:hypothetical protein
LEVSEFEGGILRQFPTPRRGSLEGPAAAAVSVNAIALKAALELVCVQVGAVPLTVLIELAKPPLPEKF